MAEQGVHVVLWRDGDHWVAWCLEYDVASQGDSEEHAMEMIHEAVELHIEDMTAEELERAFIPVDSEPLVREMTIRAPALLNRGGDSSTGTNRHRTCTTTREPHPVAGPLSGRNQKRHSAGLATAARR